MPNIFIKSIDFVKKRFWSMLLIAFVSSFIVKDGNPLIMIKQSLEDTNILPLSNKLFFNVQLTYSLSISLSIISMIVYRYISIEIYSAIKEDRSPSIINGFKNIFNLGSDMFILIITILVKTLLWSLLLVIPGIIKSLEYQRAVYIKLSNPTINNKECFVGAEDEMDGRKLSLFGWEFLVGLIAFAILVIPTMIFAVWDIGMSMATGTRVFSGLTLYLLFSFVVILLSTIVMLTIEPMFNAELDELIYE